MSKRKLTTIRKPSHVHVSQKILDINNPLVDSREITRPQPVLIEDTQDVTSTYKPLPYFQNTRMIQQESLMALAANIWSTSPKHFLPHHMRREEDKIRTSRNISNFCAPVVHPVTGETISKYKKYRNRYRHQRNMEDVMGNIMGKLGKK